MAAPSTQKFIKIENIRDDVVIIRGGAMRAVLKVSSINLALKSPDEQEAVIFEYQNFLNSLEFSVQIFVNSRFTNIDDYLSNLKEMIPQQKSELLKMQTEEYIRFIKTFVESTDIVSTDFYLVVPFHLTETITARGGTGERLKGLFGISGSAMDPEQFLHYKGQLVQRVDFVASGLHRVGLAARMLNTKELISLYWSLYNSSDLRKQNLIKPLFEE